MGSLKEVQFIGCLGHHGPYTFYKSVKIDARILSVSSFFPVRIYPDSAIFSIAEVQLLWSDRAENFVSLRLYFLPENTPEGRRRHHGEDEVIALQDKVIIRLSDVCSWLVDESEWDWGYILPGGNNIKEGTMSSTATPSSSESSHLKRAFSSDRFLKNEKIRDISETGSNRVLVLNYQRYVRVRTLLKRLEGSSELNNWLSDPLVLALGGLNISPNCRLLFSKEVFDYPELEDHELLCNHLAPKLKGRPRKRKRDRSVGSESNKSSSSTTSAASSEAKKKSSNGFSIVNPCIQTRIELEKQVSSPLSPKSDGSDRPPESPVENLSNSGSSDESSVRTPPIESNEKMQQMNTTNGVTSVELSSLTSNLKEALPPKNPKKNGQFHHSKKRKGIRVNNPKSPHTVAYPLKSEEKSIELESTTIKVTSPPPQPSSPPPLIISTEEPELMEEPVSPNCEMLEPALLELAEKLEKSNALQILPMRPSVITKQEPILTDTSAPPLKKCKTDEFLSIPSVTVSEVGKKSNSFKLGATGGPKRVIPSPLGGGCASEKSKLSLTGSVKGLPFANNKNNADLLQQIPKPAHQAYFPSASYSKFNNADLLEKPALSITTVETDPKRTAVFPVAWSSPSPFLPTRRIYGDPCISKIKQNQSTLTLRSLPNQNSSVPHQSNGFNIPLQGQQYENVLDFSVKRHKRDSAPPPPSLNLNVNVNLNLDSECLDLSTHKSQKQVYHTISDIPPPNAMNQLGLRLTSEVTLFPSHHPQHQQQKQSKRGLTPPAQPELPNKRKPSIQYNSSSSSQQQQYPPQPQIHMQGNHQPSRKQPQQPRHFQDQQQASKRAPEFPEQRSHTGSGTSTKMNSANIYNQSTNPNIWRPTSTTAPSPSSGSSGGNIQQNPSYSRSVNNARDPMGFIHSSNSRGPKPSNKPPNVRCQSPPGQHLQRSPPKQSPTMPPGFVPNSHHHQPLDDRRADRNGGLSFEQLASSFGNFMLPPHIGPMGFQNPQDAPYFSPFGSPFQLPPSAFMRLPPGAMESLQLAYMQQGLSPHLGNWPPSGKESRSQK